MTRKYSLLKRLVQAIPGPREALVTAFTLLPRPLSIKAYDALRRFVFRGNQVRLNAFYRAFEKVSYQTTGKVNYFEFEVARCTSVIARYMTAREKELDLPVFTFASFANPPSNEGGFAK